MLLLSFSLRRLTPLALEPIAQEMLTPGLAALYCGWVAANLYLEGYRGFQRGFVPGVAARAVYVACHPTWPRVALAPLFAMGLLGTTLRRRVISWSILVGVWTLVMLMRLVPQPWRGIVDGGVVAGLAWGVGALVVEAVRVLKGGVITASPEVEQAVRIRSSR